MVACSIEFSCTVWLSPQGILDEKGRNAVLCDTIAIHAQKQPEWMAAMFAATRFPNCSQPIVSYGCVTILLIYI